MAANNAQTPGGTRPRSRRRFWKDLLLGLIFLGALCGLVYIAIYAIFIIGYVLHGPGEVESTMEVCRVDLPGKTKVFFRYQPTSQEGDRQLYIDRPGVQAVTLDLPQGSGENTIINVYSCRTVSPDGQNKRMLLLVDKRYDMLIDLDKAETANDPLSAESTKDALKRISEKQYIGRLDPAASPLRFIPADKAAEKPIERPGPQ